MTFIRFDPEAGLAASTPHPLAKRLDCGSPHRFATRRDAHRGTTPIRGQRVVPKRQGMGALPGPWRTLCTPNCSRSVRTAGPSTAFHPDGANAVRALMRKHFRNSKRNLTTPPVKVGHQTCNRRGRHCSQHIIRHHPAPPCKFCARRILRDFQMSKTRKGDEACHQLPPMANATALGATGRQTGAGGTSPSMARSRPGATPQFHPGPRSDHAVRAGPRPCHKPEWPGAASASSQKPRSKGWADNAKRSQKNPHHATPGPRARRIRPGTQPWATKECIDRRMSFHSPSP